MTAPNHLAKFDTTIIPQFAADELLFRRFTYEGDVPESKQHVFLKIRWDDLAQGLSVNRSSVSKKFDVLWSWFDENVDEQKCNWEFKLGFIYESQARYYPTGHDPKTGVNFALLHSPTNCNISHCDIVCDQLPQKASRTFKIDVKAFLSTFFK